MMRQKSQTSKMYISKMVRAMLNSGGCTFITWEPVIAYEEYMNGNNSRNPVMKMNNDHPRAIVSNLDHVMTGNACNQGRARSSAVLAGIILCMRPANERRRYIVTSSFIGWAHAQTDPCLVTICKATPAVCLSGMLDACKWLVISRIHSGYSNSWRSLMRDGNAMWTRYC